MQSTSQHPSNLLPVYKGRWSLSSRPAFFIPASSHRCKQFPRLRRSVFFKTLIFPPRRLSERERWNEFLKIVESSLFPRHATSRPTFPLLRIRSVEGDSNIFHTRVNRLKMSPLDVTFSIFLFLRNFRIFVTILHYTSSFTIFFQKISKLIATFIFNSWILSQIFPVLCAHQPSDANPLRFAGEDPLPSSHLR